MKQLAYEGGFFNINVNAIVPGPTHEPNPEKDRTDGRLPRVPLGRFARPEDQAKAIVFLASAWSEMITGVALDVDAVCSLDLSIGRHIYRNTRVLQI